MDKLESIREFEVPFIKRKTKSRRLDFQDFGEHRNFYAYNLHIYIKIYAYVYIFIYTIYAHTYIYIYFHSACMHAYIHMYDSPSFFSGSLPGGEFSPQSFR